MGNFVERKDYNKVITIKLVIPSGCNANCKFCYNKDYACKMKNNKKEFIDNFIESIDYLIKEIGNKNEISLDITGNEPTFDVELLKDILIKLKEYNIKDKVLRATMTTNGFNLNNIIPYLEGVVDYINISIHDYRSKEREKIFGTKTLNDIDYYEITNKLKEIDITCSAICVVYKEINNFSKFMMEFIKWCQDNNFISLRFRNNVFWKDTKFEDYMEIGLNHPEFDILEHENTNDSHWCRLRKKDKFRVFFLSDVVDTSLTTKGIEYVVAENGKIYCDFYKNTPIENYKYEIGKIYDYKED